MKERLVQVTIRNQDFVEFANGAIISDALAKPFSVLWYKEHIFTLLYYTKKNILKLTITCG